MLFRDRKDAAEKLSDALSEYSGRDDVLVIALPRGGVVIGRIVADRLGAPLDIVVPRKLGARMNPEYAVGAVTESGHVVWNEKERAQMDDGYADRVVREEKEEARRRLDLYRKGLPERDFKRKAVIVVDDGIATGFTIRAAISTVKAGDPARVVAAVPVGPPDTVETLRKEVDDLVVLSVPSLFFAIGQFYGTFDQVEDDEVIALLNPEK